MLAGNTTQMLAGEFTPGAGWTTTALTGSTADSPAIALTGSSSAVGLMRASTTGELRFTTWNGSAWTAFAAVASGVTTRAAPSITAVGAAAGAVFHGDDFKHYFGSHAAAWSPVAEPVGAGAAQSFGPSPASIAADGSDVVIAFAGSNQDLYDQRRTGGSWQPAIAHGLGSVVSLTPSIVTLKGGAADRMIVFVRVTDARILYTTESAGVWSAPVVIDTNALTSDRVSVAALPGGGAVLGYRGQNGKVYWSRYTPGSSPPWTAAAGVTAANFDTPTPPVLAPGASGAEAEMVFIDATSGSVKHARLNGAAWSAPITVGGGGMNRVAAGSFQ